MTSGRGQPLSGPSGLPWFIVVALFMLETAGVGSDPRANDVCMSILGRLLGLFDVLSYSW